MPTKMLTRDFTKYRDNESYPINCRSTSWHLTSYQSKYQHVPKEICFQCCWGTDLFAHNLLIGGRTKQKEMP